MSGRSWWMERHQSGQGPPKHALKLGHQTDGAGPLWVGVADSEVGRVPGKVTGGWCWYPYADKEHQTSNFWWICSDGNVNMMASNGSGHIPAGAIDSGRQKDGHVCYAVIANTPYGQIPGKAIPGGAQCWFSYGGKELLTSSFSYIVIY
eukprot:GHVU01020356.1.p1 GENE.GHVU01020356.1~~GHVU01020356.1.p1  ORF type:complete len:149 (+),score=4.95 GHVU01020356.1:81-527(+)